MKWTCFVLSEDLRSPRPRIKARAEAAWKPEAVLMMTVAHTVNIGELSKCSWKSQTDHRNSPQPPECDRRHPNP